MLTCCLLRNKDEEIIIVRKFVEHLLLKLFLFTFCRLVCADKSTIYVLYMNSQSVLYLNRPVKAVSEGK